jgi:hypothetical protein
VRLRRLVFLSSCLVLSFVSCSRGKTFDLQVVPRKVPMSQVQYPNAFGAGQLAVGIVRQNERAVVARVLAERVSAHAAPSAGVVPPTSTPAALATSFSPCGGTDYPPCWRVQTESRGEYGAYNPTGCGGHGCFGKWQFSGAWAGKLGLPVDIAHATPQEQDNAARLLWAGGAGCSNWSAC